MRIPERQIGSTYIRQDTNTNKADEFANVRDLQQHRINHNTLLSRRVRRCLLSHCFRDGGQLVDGPKMYSASPLLASIGTPIFLAPIMLTPHVRELVVNLRGKLIATYTTDVDVVPMVFAEGQYTELHTDVIMNFDSTTEENISATIQIPRVVQDDRRGIFCLFLQGTMENSTDKGAAVTITDADNGGAWVEAETGYSTVGAVAYFPTDATITPRLVSVYQATTADRHFFDMPLNRPPNVGTDTIRFRPCTGLHLQTLCVYEEHLTTGGASGRATNHHV